MDFVDVMTTYFRGEKLLGIVLVPVGLGVLGFAGHLWRAHTGGFMWAMIIPLFLVGVGFAAGGTVLAIKSDRQMSDLQQQFREAPAEMVAEERARMDKVNANWPRIKMAWTIIIAISLLLVMVVRTDWALGLGLAFLLVASFMMALDVFAEKRANVYTAGLQQFGDLAGGGQSAPPGSIP